MSFLSKHQILAQKEKFFPDSNKDPRHFKEENLKEACYDLCVGNEVILSGDSIPTSLSDEKPYVVLPPGQFALIKTFEKIAVPKKYVAFISIRSLYKFQGLINISGFHVDPTYEGNLIFSVQNVGPRDIHLKYLEPTFMIMWAKLDEPYEPKPKEDEPKRTGYDRITLDQVRNLAPTSPTIYSLKKEIDSLHIQFKIYGAIAVSAFLALLGILIINLNK